MQTFICWTNWSHSNTKIQEHLRHEIQESSLCATYPTKLTRTWTLCLLRNVKKSIRMNSYVQSIASYAVTTINASRNKIPMNDIHYFNLSATFDYNMLSHDTQRNTQLPSFPFLQ